MTIRSGRANQKEHVIKVCCFPKCYSKHSAVFEYISILKCVCTGAWYLVPWYHYKVAWLEMSM